MLSNRFLSHYFSSTIGGDAAPAKSKQIHFLLCGSCFWCASYLDLCETVEKCPSCMNDKVESMPVSDKEIYTFGYDAMRGVTLAFKSNR
jgi:hypothetical protein